MDEQRKYAILFAATILATRKLSEAGITPWARECAITDAIQKAEHILEKIDERWPSFSTCITIPHGYLSLAASLTSAPPATALNFRFEQILSSALEDWRYKMKRFYP